MARRLYPWLLGAVITVGLIIGVTVAVVLVRSNRKATLRLNCGGPALRGVLADNATFTQQTNASVRTQRVPDWETDLYRSNAYVENGGDLVYTFQVQAGSRVEVRARFVELWDGAKEPDTRLLRVLVNGVIVADRLDIYRTVGGLRKPFDRTHRFTASNGAVEVRVRPLAQNAVIAGIDVIANGGVKAGGPLAVLPNTTTPNNATTTNPTNSTNSTTNTNTTTPDTPASTTPANPTVPVPTPAPQPAPVAPPNTPKLVGSGQWRTAATSAASAKPAERHEACAVMNNGRVYLIGGRGMRPVSVYDPKTRVWTNKPQPPVELNHMQCVSLGTDIYVVGAWFGKFPRESAHKDTYVYSTVSDTWSTKPGMPAARNRGGGATVVYQGKIYVAMGNQGGHGAHATSLGYLDVYDPATQKWQALPDAPNPRDHVGGAVVAGNLCVLGGRDGGVANFWGSPVTKVNCYDFASGSWTVGPDLPEGRAGAATGPLCDGEHVMIAGGEGRPAGTNSGGKAYDRVDLYSVKDKVFRTPAKLKRGRHGSGLAVMDCACGNVYLPSGSGGLGGGPELDDMEVWSPDGVVRDC